MEEISQQKILLLLGAYLVNQKKRMPKLLSLERQMVNSLEKEVLQTHKSNQQQVQVFSEENLLNQPSQSNSVRMEPPLPNLSPTT